MKIIFLTSLIEPIELEDIIKNCKLPFSFASQNLQEKIAKGLMQNKVELKIVNALMVGMFPNSYKKISIPSKKWFYNKVSCTQVGGINIQPFKDISRTRKIINILKREIDSTDDDVYVLVYDLIPVFIDATHKLKKSRDFTLVYYVPDLPMQNAFTKTNPFLRYLSNRRFRKINSKLESSDGYIFISKHMKNSDIFDDKPFIVIEGMVDYELEKKQFLGKDKSMRIVYTGSLHKEYGIMNLVDSFEKMNDEKYELHIYGSGDCADEINKIAARNKSIFFNGLVRNTEISKILKNATLLVNPRTNTEAFSYNSFPSKIHDYMQSGRPILLYRLGGIPSEYDSYLNYINGKSIDFSEDLIHSLEDIKELEDRATLGMKFVNDEKNNVVQVKKITDFMRGIKHGKA